MNVGKETVSLQRLIRLIDRLHTDFGPNFVTGLTASAQALLNTDETQRRTNIDYRTLEVQRGHLINWCSIPIFGRRKRSGDPRNGRLLDPNVKGWRANEQPNKRYDRTPTLVRKLNPYIGLLRHDVYRDDRILIAVSTTSHARGETPRDLRLYVDPHSLRSLLELLRWSYVGE